MRHRRRLCGHYRQDGMPGWRRLCGMHQHRSMRRQPTWAAVQNHRHAEATDTAPLNTCVECTVDTDCTDPNASVCRGNQWCLAKSNTDCSHVDSTPGIAGGTPLNVCDAGSCVQCTGSSEGPAGPRSAIADFGNVQRFRQGPPTLASHTLIMTQTPAAWSRRSTFNPSASFVSRSPSVRQAPATKSCSSAPPPPPRLMSRRPMCACHVNRRAQRVWHISPAFDVWMPAPTCRVAAG